jgi:hypothetical protein
LRFAILIAMCSAPAVGLVAGFAVLFGWIAGEGPKEIGVYFLMLAMPVIIIVAVGSLQRVYGPDWREGLRRYAAWLRYPHSAWWPTPNMAWDGSNPHQGIESEHTTAMRTRYPAWFAKYEAPVSAPQSKERP